VATINGIKFINDSKATNVDSVWYALQSVAAPIILIAGGKDKGSSYQPLSALVKERVKMLIVIGQAATKIKTEIGLLTKTADAPSLEEAVEIAYKNSQPNDTVLLSPACASFDMFENFEHRGRVFKQKVSELLKKYGR
jgi:UDP-N-acetylmuramoylalanine--D-glutamate ligase